MNAKLHKWENPLFFKENKLDGRNLALPFDLKDRANPDESKYKLSLNGIWKFYWQMGIKNEPACFEQPGFYDNGWDEIPVPSVWQSFGYGKPIYLCSYMPPQVSTIESEIPKVSHSRNEIGLYRKTFTLPAEFAGRRLILHFGAAKSAMYVYLNGKYVGYSQGSMTPAEFDVTDFVVDGENLLAVKLCDSVMLLILKIRICGSCRVSTVMFTSLQSPKQPSRISMPQLHLMRKSRTVFLTLR